MASDDSQRFGAKTLRALGTLVSPLTSALNKLRKVESVLMMAADDSNPSLAITPEKLKNILDEAATGECQSQAALIEYMLEKDPRLLGLLETRRDAITSANWRCFPADGTPYDDAKSPDVIELEQVLRESRFGTLIPHLASAVDYGYMGAALAWKPGGVGFDWIPIHQTSVVFDEAGFPALRDREDNDYPFEDFPPNQFVLHTHLAKAGHPARGGLGRSLAWYWLFKHMSTDRWVKYVDRFGLPFILAQVSKADLENEAYRDTLASNLRRMAQQGVVFVSDVGKAATQSEAGHNNRIHNEFHKYIDSTMAICVLGQVGSSEGEKGRLGGSGQQDAVRDDKRENDCIRMMLTCQNIVRQQWVNMHGGDGLDCPTFWMQYHRPEDIVKFASAVKALYDAGHMVNPAYIRTESGMDVSGPVEQPVAETTPPDAATQPKPAAKEKADAKKPKSKPAA